MTEQPEQAIPEEVMREARELGRQFYHTPFAREQELLARALIAAEARGREAQREADARIAEAHHAAPPHVNMSRADAYAYAVAHGGEIATAIRNA